MNDDWILAFKGSFALLPLMVVPAALLIGIQLYKIKKLGKQFADAMVRKGVVQEMGVREPTRMRPYRHCFVKCSFQNSTDWVEVPYEGGDLKDTQVGDEISVYFYPNGTTTVVAFDESTVKKKLRQQIILVLVTCVVMSLLIPVYGIVIRNKFGS